jgi:N-acylneuraminate cytidylyltransferase
MNVAIIPARGGSKRIPRKNLRSFCGEPIISYSIKTALQSGLFSQVIVSTDDAEIAAMALSLGAQVPFMRPAELANDHASTLAVMQHAAHACSALGLASQRLCCLYATAPFAQTDDLRAALALLDSTVDGKHVQYAFSATSFAAPVQRAFRLDSASSVEPVWPDNIPMRSQDLEPLFHDAGQFYWGQTSAFAAMLPLFAPHSRAFILPRHRVQDIDDEDDWARAEWLYRAWKGISGAQ